MFGICQMAAKHLASPWEHVLGPSGFTKHRKLTFRPPNFNSGGDNWSWKPPFASRSPSGDLLDSWNLGSWILDSGSWILNSELWIVNYELWIVDYELWITNCEISIMNYELSIMNSDSQSEFPWDSPPRARDSLGPRVDQAARPGCRGGNRNRNAGLDLAKGIPNS